MMTLPTIGQSFFGSAGGVATGAGVTIGFVSVVDFAD